MHLGGCQIRLGFQFGRFDRSDQGRRRASLGGSKVDRIGAGDRSRCPIFTGQECDPDAGEKSAGQERIEVPHAFLIQVEHAPRLKRSNIVDLDNELFGAAFDQRIGRLIEPAVPNAAKLVA